MRSSFCETVERGEFVRLAYRLGSNRASGVLTVHRDNGDGRVVVLRRGSVLVGRPEPGGPNPRVDECRLLSRLAGLDRVEIRFDGGAAAYPPGQSLQQVSLVRWARRHLERQVDSAYAVRLARELAGARLRVRSELVADDCVADDADRRILAALDEPRRIDQVWRVARTPRFRLLAFLHFLRTVGALDELGVAAPAPRPEVSADARAMLGVSHDADRATVKRAFRRIARALHPDLHAGAEPGRKRALELKFAQIHAAYRELTESGM